MQFVFVFAFVVFVLTLTCLGKDPGRPYVTHDWLQQSLCIAQSCAGVASHSAQPSIGSNVTQNRPQSLLDRPQISRFQTTDGSSQSGRTRPQFSQDPPFAQISLQDSSETFLDQPNSLQDQPQAPEPQLDPPYTIRPLKLGVEIEGVNLLSSINNSELFARIKADAHKHRLLLFRNQGAIEAETLVDMFGKRLGDAYSSPWATQGKGTENHEKAATSAIMRISNDPAQGFKGLGTTGWHIDGGYTPKPFAFLVFNSIEAPRVGATKFAGHREIISSMKSSTLRRMNRLWTATTRNMRGQPVYEIHPVLYTHPVVNEPVFCLHLGYMHGLIGDYGWKNQTAFTLHDQYQFKGEITHEIVKENERLVYSHKWRKGDIVIVDNLQVFHFPSRESQLPKEKPPPIVPSYTIRPLKLGIEISDILLTNHLDNRELLDRLKSDVYKHRLVIVRGQGRIATDQLLQMFRGFGEAFDKPFTTQGNGSTNHAKSPASAIMRISNDLNEGYKGLGTSGWHIDGAYKAEPYSFLIFNAIHAPDVGNTNFVGHRELLASMKLSTVRMLDRLWTAITRTVWGNRVYEIHPLIHTHPVVKEPALCLHLGYMRGAIRDYGTPNQTVLDPSQMLRLKGRITQEIKESSQRLVYSHKWLEGDLVIIDNWQVLHMASKETQLPADQIGLRVLHRLAINGTQRPTKSDIDRS